MNILPYILTAIGGSVIPLFTLFINHGIEIWKIKRADDVVNKDELLQLKSAIAVTIEDFYHPDRTDPIEIRKLSHIYHQYQFRDSARNIIRELEEYEFQADLIRTPEPDYEKPSWTYKKSIIEKIDMEAVMIYKAIDSIIIKKKLIR